MGNKLKKLLKETAESGQIIPYSRFTSNTDPKEMTETELRYGISFQYNYLARFLPEFIAAYSLEELKTSSKYRNPVNRKKAASMSPRALKRYVMGKRIKMILKQKSVEEIREEMIDMILNSDKATIRNKFSPKTFKISSRAMEQYHDFMTKYKTMKTPIMKNKSGRKLYKKSSHKIVRRIGLKETKMIFKASQYDPKLFIEYCKVNPSFNDLFITTGLEVYRNEHLLSNSKSDSVYKKAIDRLSQRPKSIGLQKTIRGLNLYREYYEEFTAPRYNKKVKIRNPKENAINTLDAKQRLESRGYFDKVPSLNEIIKNYTNFFRFIEQSNLKPYNTKKYLEYLCKIFPEKLIKGKDT